jgi:hypothetical protein
MPDLKSFLGKEPANNYEGWEEVMGEYGCSTCDESSNVAYFNEILGKMVWICPNKHETSFKL